MRAVAVDINPRYLVELERRHESLVQSREVVCGDAAGVDFAPVDYVRAAWPVGKRFVALRLVFGGFAKTAKLQACAGRPRTER